MSFTLKDTSAEELKHYVIHEHIGAGAAGDAFKVTDRRDQHEYVLKQMSLQSMSDDEKLRARQEIDVMNNVSHPNVVKFRESFSGVDSVNIVMEYCEGGTLEELITRQRYEGKVFPGNVILEWMAQLLCALAHIHEKGILHRDIKTGNIFVTKKNHLKLGDFGVCTLLTNKKLAEASLIGTPLYFSPEVCEQKTYDERSDVWSLGIVFYEMCTLRRPYEANNLIVLINKIISEPITPFNTGLDLRFEEIVRDMLNKDPVKRPTAQALIDDYLEVPQNHPSHPSQKPALGRYIQQQFGPTLMYSKPWPISREELAKYANGKIAKNNNNNAIIHSVSAGVSNDNDNDVECNEVDDSYNVTSEWLDTCEAIDLAVLLQTNAFAYHNTYTATSSLNEENNKYNDNESNNNDSDNNNYNKENKVNNLQIVKKMNNYIMDNIKNNYAKNVDIIKNRTNGTSASKMAFKNKNNNSNIYNSSFESSNKKINCKRKKGSSSVDNNIVNKELMPLVKECKSTTRELNSNHANKHISPANKATNTKNMNKQVVKFHYDNKNKNNSNDDKTSSRSKRTCTDAIAKNSNISKKAVENKLSTKEQEQKVKCQSKISPPALSVTPECLQPFMLPICLTDVHDNILRTRQAMFGESASEVSSQSYVIELPLKRLSSSLKDIEGALAQVSESFNIINSKKRKSSNAKSEDVSNSIDTNRRQETSEGNSNDSFIVSTGANMTNSNVHNSVESDNNSIVVKNENINKVGNIDRQATKPNLSNQLHFLIDNYIKTHDKIELSDIAQSVALLDSYRQTNYTGKL